MPTVTIDPVTRIEGHLGIEVEIESQDGEMTVSAARCSGTMFRGFESILLKRDPRDATHLTQRICGVCPIAHGMASSLALEDAFGVTPPPNGRLLRNLVLGANFLQSHILHFYHLAALDYLNTTGILDMAPWSPRYTTPDMVSGSAAAGLVGHYVEALEMRRKSHQLGAIVGGRLPCTPTFVAGGSTERVTSQKIGQLASLLGEIKGFIDSRLVPDTLAVAELFPEYFGVGFGCGNLLAYGVFDLNASGSQKLLKRGRITNGQPGSVEPGKIMEYVGYSRYSGKPGNPSSGKTKPDGGSKGSYSWIKAPRYEEAVHEVGPLARMTVNGDYVGGVSVLDRLAARALEAQKIAAAMEGWIGELEANQAAYEPCDVPKKASGIGLTEAPRGALGHWVSVSGGTIKGYQIVTPTAWNASPRDDLEQSGPIEEALLGTVVRDMDQPIELLRVVHSFDPCLSCAVHLARPGEARTVYLPH
jgi:hydrogenase large subunit